MSSNGQNISKEIYDLCKEYYKYEGFITSNNNKKFNGYLINKKYIDDFKNNIYYDKLSNYLKYDYNYKTAKIHIEKIKLQKIERNITQEKCKILEEFIKLLDNNGEYYIINESLWKKICQKEKIYEEGISCEIKKKNIVILNFENEKIEVKINKGIIIKENKNVKAIQDSIDKKLNLIITIKMKWKF